MQLITTSLPPSPLLSISPPSPPLPPEVHTMLDALLPPDTYFRFNPLLSEDVPLDESRSERLNFLKGEGERYMLRNDAKLRRAAAVLAAPKGHVQRLADWAKLKTDMYDGLPFTSSKL